MTSDSMKQYYARRAGEYESIYAKPERQADLRVLERRIAELLAGRAVLEIACGTGYWTQFAATSARSVTATDINPEVLAIAQAKQYHTMPQFLIADAYAPAGIHGDFDAALVAFWWSHIPREQLGDFLKTLHKSLPADSLVVFLDNRYVEGSSTSMSATDAHGNTYQDRTLADGSTHRVLKNFYSGDELRRIISPFSRDLQVQELQYYWLVTVRTR